MRIEIIPAIKYTASDDMVLYALTTRIAMIWTVLLSTTWFRFVYSASILDRPPSLILDEDTLARKR